jgi:hypothetical protein
VIVAMMLLLQNCVGMCAQQHFQPVWGIGRWVGDVLVVFCEVGQAKTLENSDFATKITEINLELSGNSQRYINECCESESDGKIKGFGGRC